MDLIAIAAVARNNAIGRSGDIPWNIPEDWRRFKRVTMGANLIMGRVTFEAIGDPLPGRTSIVITRNPPPPSESPASPVESTASPVESPASPVELPNPVVEPVETPDPETRVLWVSSLDEALAAADPTRPIYVAGGAEIYRLAWDRLTALDITEVDQAPEADSFFPQITEREWVEVSRDPRDGYAFVQYRRR